MTQPKIQGRGTAENPSNRFRPTAYERDAEWNEPDDPAPKTQFYRDASASIITYNNSPDVGIEASINPYRGCELRLRSLLRATLSRVPRFFRGVPAGLLRQVTVGR